MHIVSFDVPAPPNYGGVIDVFHKLRSLHALGIKITLHCFEYGDRKRSETLEKYTDEVYYYKRITGIQGLSLLRPYIVNSRKNPLLLKNLLSDDAPILFEGIHTCYYLNHPTLSQRKKFVRTHNVEHDYYRSLAQAETQWWKKYYFKFEAKMLENYEVILKEADALFSLSEKDVQYFSSINETTYVAAFHGSDTVFSELGHGEYCLFHANLAVAENEEAAKLLIENVFSKLRYPVKIAGANPSEALLDYAEAYSHIEIIANPTEDVMLDLKRKAQVHVLFSNQATGVKLKLIDSLCQGRFVIANDKILNDISFLDTTISANNWKEYCELIGDVFLDTFTQDHLDIRQKVIQSQFTNSENAQKLISSIFSK